MRTSKYAFTVFNFIFLVLSIVLLAIGLYLYFEKSNKLAQIIFLHFPNDSTLILGNEFEQVFRTIGLISIGCGIFLFILSTTGYAGAMQHVRVLLGVYIVLNTLVLIGTAGVVAYLIVWGPDHLKKEMSSLPERFYTIQSSNNSSPSSSSQPQYKRTPVTEWFETFMEGNECCGINNHSDFPFLNETDPLLGRLQLKECCKKLNSTSTTTTTKLLIEQCPNDFNKENSNFEDGCFDKMCRSFFLYGLIFCCVLVAVQFLGLVLSILVYRASYYDYF